MSTQLARSRKFRPGTTGWTIDDLDDPRIEQLWQERPYEIVEGVLTRMPPAYVEGSYALSLLTQVVAQHLQSEGKPGVFLYEVDLVLERKRVPRADALLVTPEDLARQQQLHAATGKNRRLKYGRLLLPPPLIIESLSKGHEDHDRETKRKWYAEFGIPNYWLLNAHDRSLQCLALRGPEYQGDAEGTGAGEVRPSAFPGLVISLSKLWI